MLHYIEIYISNLTKSKLFWSWLLTELHYEKYQEWEDDLSFNYGVTYLVFVQAKDKYMQER